MAYKSASTIDMLAADEKLTDDILAAKLNSLGYAEANTRYWLDNNRDKFLWAVSKTDEAAKKGKVKSYGAYLTAMLKQDVSFDYSQAQAHADEARKARNDRINAERLAESDRRIKAEREKAEDIIDILPRLKSWDSRLRANLAYH